MAAQLDCNCGHCTYAALDIGVSGCCFVLIFVFILVCPGIACGIKYALEMFKNALRSTLGCESQMNYVPLSRIRSVARGCTDNSQLGLQLNCPRPLTFLASIFFGESLAGFISRHSICIITTVGGGTIFTTVCLR